MTGIHCSFDYSMRWFAIRETVRKAYRGEPQLISKEALFIAPEWKTIIADFCQRAGIPLPQEIGWWLTSLYG